MITEGGYSADNIHRQLIQSSSDLRESGVKFRQVVFDSQFWVKGRRPRLGPVTGFIEKKRIISTLEGANTEYQYEKIRSRVAETCTIC